MARFDLQDFKKQASFFLREKLNDARLALTDVSRIQLLTEEATNEDPWGPETRTMAILAVAAFELEEYERIVQVIHHRLDGIKKRPWRQVLKTLVVLEYLLTHGPNSVGKEFRDEISCMEELSQFNYTDQQGIDRGSTVRKMADRVLKLLSSPDLRKEERMRARQISFGIRGFGSSLNQEPPVDGVEDKSRGIYSEGLSVSSNKLSEESVKAANTTSQLGRMQVPYEKCSSLSSEPKPDNSSKLAGKENIPATSLPLEENNHMRLFKKSLSNPGYFRERLPNLGWHPANNDIRELGEASTRLLDAVEERRSPSREASTCLLDAVEERESPSCEYVQEGRDTNGLLIGWTSDAFTEQGCRGDGMNIVSYESAYSGFEGIGAFSLADNCKPSMQMNGAQLQSCNFSNFPILPQQPAHPKLRIKFQHQFKPTSLIDCDAKFGKAA